MVAYRYGLCTNCNGVREFRLKSRGVDRPWKWTCRKCHKPVSSDVCLGEILNDEEEVLDD